MVAALMEVSPMDVAATVTSRMVAAATLELRTDVAAMPVDQAVRHRGGPGPEAGTTLAVTMAKQAGLLVEELAAALVAA